MAITTFSELKTAIADTINRSDLTSVIPNWIAMFEAAVSREMRVQDMITRNTAYSISTAFTAVPADFRQATNLRLTSTSPTKPLVFRTAADMLNLQEVHGDTAGEPVWYSVVGSNLQVVPAPGQTYTAELTYYGKLTALSDGAPSNWMLSKHPDAYLYGSLVHSAPYLKDDDRIQIWGGLVQAALESIRRDDDGYKIGGAAPSSFGRAIG